MKSIATVLAFAAIALGANETNSNVTLTKDVISILTDKLAIDDLALLNATVNKFEINKELVAKLSSLTNKTRAETVRVPTYNAYDDGNGPKIGVVDESPDYASSVVLASDLLSLTSAVAAVKEKTCREHGYKFLDGLLMNRRWALKMFDASAKSPQGLLFGSSYHLGNFDECVGIEDPGDNGVSIAGQYCLATIKWKQRTEKKQVRTGRGETLRWAVCVPSACNADAVESFVNSVLSYTVGNSTGVEVTDRDCYKRTELPVTSLDIGFLSLILLFATILIFSTIFEVYTIYYCKERESTIIDLIKSFSVINNMKKIISTKQHTSFGLECITGIKALAMIFILAGHACIFIASGPVMDAEAWDRLVKQPLNGFMLNNALLVDTFLMLSAFLFSRLLLIELDKRRGRLNVIPILVFRYIRVTPAYMVVILFYMTWFPKIGEGPLWDDRLLLEKERCMESWWTNILYINNYVNTDKLFPIFRHCCKRHDHGVTGVVRVDEDLDLRAYETVYPLSYSFTALNTTTITMCMFQSWYLSVDTQLFFIAPIFILSLWRWRRVGLVLISLAIVVSMVIPAAVTYMDNLDPTFLFYAKEVTDITTNFYFKTAYIKTHMKMTMYFMGILTGYVLHRIQSQNYQFSNLLKTFGWVTSVILGTVVTFSVSLFYQDWYQYNNIEAAAYISLHKLAWSICNAWLIIACATGNGGIFNKLLSWKFLAPISRLTFCAYLVNGIIELYYVGQLRHPVHITFFTVFASAISHIVLTFTLAVILCLTFESPLHGIEKILLRRFARPPISDNVRRNESAESSRNTSQSKLDS